MTDRCLTPKNPCLHASLLNRTETTQQVSKGLRWNCTQQLAMQCQNRLQLASSRYKANNRSAWSIHGVSKWTGWLQFATFN